MAQADGTILIDTEIDADGMKAGSKEVEAHVRRMAASVNDLGTKAKTALNKQIAILSKLNNEFAAQEKKVNALKQKVAEYGNQKIPTQEYREIQMQIEQAEKRLNNLIAAQERFLTLGGNENSKTFKGYQYDIDELRNTIKYARSELQDLEETGKAFTFGTQTKQAAADMEKLANEERKLADLNNRLGNSYSAIKGQVNALNQKLAETKAKEAQAVAEALRLRAIGDMAEVSNQDVVDLNNELTKLRARQADLEKAGLGTGYKEYDENITRIAQIEAALRDYQKSLLNTDSTQKKADQSSKKLSKSLKSTGKSANSASFGIGKMLGTSVLFSFVFQAINAVMSGITDGMSNLSRYSSSTNNSISMLWSSLERLKNSLATAFSPILETIAPILSRFIDMLSTAASYVSMFFAFLQGKDSYTRAVAVQKDYADSLKDTASGAKDATEETNKAAKAAEKYLSPLDDINKFTEKDKSGSGVGSGGSEGVGGGGEGSGPLFEKVPIDNGFSNLMDTVLDKLRSIKEILASGFWDGLGDYKPLLDGLKSDLSSIGASLRDIFTDADVQAAANRFVTSLIYNIGKNSGSFASVGLTIAANVIGGIESYLSENSYRVKTYLINMFNIGTDIFDRVGTLSATVAEIFSSVFGSQVAQDLTGNIIGIFAEAFMGVTSLAAMLGRDLLGLIVTPLVENKEKIKTALLATIAPLEQITQSIETFIQKVVDKVTTLYNEHVKPFIDSLSDGISSIVGTLLDAYNEYIAPILDKWAAKFDEVLNGPVSDAVNSLLTVIGKLFDALKTLWDNVLVPLINWIIRNIVPVIAPIIKTMGTTALSLLGTVASVVSGILDALGGLIDFIVGIFTGNWSQAFNGLKTIANGFKKAFNATFDFIRNNILTPFNNFLEDVFATDWEKNFGVFGGVLEGFFKSVKSIWKGIKEVFNGIVEFINGVFSGNWKKAWNGIKKIFKGVFDSFEGIVKTPLNVVIGIINGLISGIQTMQNNVAKAINSLSISIPDWVPVVGGNSWSPNLSIWKLPRVPYLASGAVIPPNKEFLAVLGDQKQGNNIEAPESLIRRIVREESGSSRGNTYEVNARVGRKELFRIVIDEAKIQRTQTGRNPFELA